MSEEIMIAEECSYYNKDNYPYCCEIWDNECEAQNCYYKQLKKAKKENAKLKEKLNKIENILIKCTNAGCRECECTGICEEYLLQIIRGAEDE